MPVVVLGSADTTDVLDDHVLGADLNFVMAAGAVVQLLRDRANKPGLVALRRIALQTPATIRQSIHVTNVFMQANRKRLGMRSSPGSGSI